MGWFRFAEYQSFFDKENPVITIINDWKKNANIKTESFEQVQKEQDVDQSRLNLKQILNEQIVPKFDKVSLGIVRNQDETRLDITTLHESGSLRSPFSLKINTGLVCVNLADYGISLKSADKKLFTPDRILKVFSKNVRGWMI